MKDTGLEQLLKLSRAAMKAMELKDKTVIKVNKDMLLEAKEILEKCPEVYAFGTKNTKEIDRKLLKTLKDSKKYLWHTIDGMADGGRAVDINVLNPLTGRIMTGSSSCTAINVLYGINDVGIGTDGGGSVLAPALSLNLCSIMAKGMGLRGVTNKVSTDGINFVPGIGVISQSLNLAEDTIKLLTGIKNEQNIEALKVAVCKHNNITLPEGSDMREKLNLVYNRITSLGISVEEEEFPDFKNREEAITKVKELYKKYHILITYEGPVDLLGMGDSVFGGFGALASDLQGRGGKYMVKIANMLNATAVTIPSSDISSGVVITAREGVDEGVGAINLAKKLMDLYTLPEIYYRYFKDSYKRKENDIIFSL